MPPSCGLARFTFSASKNDPLLAHCHPDLTASQAHPMAHIVPLSQPNRTLVASTNLGIRRKTKPGSGGSKSRRIRPAVLTAVNTPYDRGRHSPTVCQWRSTASFRTLACGRMAQRFCLRADLRARSGRRKSDSPCGRATSGLNRLICSSPCTKGPLVLRR